MKCWAHQELSITKDFIEISAESMDLFEHFGGCLFLERKLATKIEGKVARECSNKSRRNDGMTKTDHQGNGWQKRALVLTFFSSRPPWWSSIKLHSSTTKQAARKKKIQQQKPLISPEKNEGNGHPPRVINQSETTATNPPGSMNGIIRHPTFVYGCKSSGDIVVLFHFWKNRQDLGHWGSTGIFGFKLK